MISFEILQCDAGWGAVKLPDNMLVKAESGSQSVTFYIDMWKLMVLITMLEAQDEGELVFGTGTKATFRTADDTATTSDERYSLTIGALKACLPADEVIESFRSFLFDAIALHDEREPAERLDGFRRINGSLKHRGLPPVADQYYAEYRQQE